MTVQASSGDSAAAATATQSITVKVRMVSRYMQFFWDMSAVAGHASVSIIGSVEHVSNTSGLLGVTHLRRQTVSPALHGGTHS